MWHQANNQKRRATPTTTINPASADHVEDLILEVEGWGNFQDPTNRQSATNHLRGFGFSDQAIDEILKDVSHGTRVELAYFEAVRIQQERMIDGVADKPAPAAYGVKTVVFGNLQQQLGYDGSAAVDGINDVGPGQQEATGHDVVESVIHDDQYEEIPTVSTSLTSEAGDVAALAVASTCSEPKHRRKNALPDDVVAIVNAHYPHDRAGTIRQARLARWIPNIKEMPRYTAFDIFGELDGELVDLTIYINRVGSSCYVGNVYVRSGEKCSVAWDASLLGALPLKGEELQFRIISIDPREEVLP
jgi:hypothetical protein